MLLRFWVLGYFCV
uniref:Uncharacterized protein n=1 Tax=Anguilla anguilla TaxID=7936 RepID=A0A0E9SEF6_ANGAN